MPTKIDYVDETWNPVVGCTKCSSGCLNCYAEKMAYRLSAMGIPRYDMVQDEGMWNGNIELNADALDIPLHWRKPRRILVPSMGDLFHESVPFEFIDKVFAKIARTQRHKYLILTKRPAIMKRYITGLVHRLNGTQLVCMLNYEKWPPLNVHLGVTISIQKEADEKIPILLQIPAAHRWLSFEPLLKSINQIPFDNRNCDTLGHIAFIDWVVVGCESGPKRRPCKLEWIRSIVEQCKAAGVGCFVKQIEINGKVSHNPSEWPEWARVRNG